MHQKKILKLLNLSFENIIIDDAKFKTNNEFSFEIDEKFKVKNIILNSDINITQLKYKNIKIIKLSKTKYRVLIGPFNDIKSLKSSFEKMNELDFENLEILDNV